MKLFVRFKEEFSSLEHEEYNRWNWPADEEDFRYQQALKIKKWISECLIKNVFPREDYRELAELTAFCLGVEIPRGLFIRRPGADHHARFMSKAIYILKIFIMSNTFELYGSEKEEVDKMVEFILLFYSYYFLRSPLAASAPASDLQLAFLMRKYKVFEEATSIGVTKSITRHLDYLTEELVVFSLFDEELADSDKEMIAQKLFQIQRQSSLKPGKPKPPKIIWPTEEDPPHLSSFLGPRLVFI